MLYKLLYTKRAILDITKLDEQSKQRIKLALEKYSIAPFQYAEKLTNSQLGSFRFRVGDYRIIFDIEDESIVVLRIGHRKNIYLSN